MFPGCSHDNTLPPLTPTESDIALRLRAHVSTLAGDIGERNTIRYPALVRASEYIAHKFAEVGFEAREQSFLAYDKQVSNIWTEIKGTEHPEEIVVIGAHYDSPPGSPGADDNASGTAAILELARLLRSKKPARTVRFIAFVNEEPPYFQTDTMGSRVYAANLAMLGEKIVAMIALESIGYYSDDAGSQRYPFPLNLFYPKKGNFIGFVGNIASRSLIRRCVGAFRDNTSIPSESVAAPEFISGIDWSDHWSFWQEGYPALMVTDTAPYRNPHYHEPDDTPDHLDYDRMARVVTGMEGVIVKLAK